MKKTLPLNISKLVNEYYLKFNDIIEYNEGKNYIIRFEDKDKNTGNYFEITKVMGINKKNEFTIYYIFSHKPYSSDFFEEVIDLRGAFDKMKASFLDWIKLLKEYKEINTSINSQRNKQLSYKNNNLRTTTEKLKKITIQNFKLFKNIEIDLSSKINIILGENAFGKTSFLQALTIAALPEKNEDTLSLKLKQFINKGENAFKINLKYENEDEYETKNEDFYIAQRNLYIKPVILLAYCANTFTKYEKLNYKLIIDDLLFGTNKWHYTESIFADYTNSFYDTLGVLNSLLLKNSNEASKIESIITRTLNTIIPKDIRLKKLENSVSYFFYDKQNNELTTEQLSEGYRNNIIFLTDIILRIISVVRKNTEINAKDFESNFKTINGIIAIDEFDRHLHPAWQKNYLNKLSDTFPNIQFIVTTHNPVSILDRNADEIIEFVVNENNDIIHKKYEGTKYLDLGTIFLTYFGLESVISPSLQNTLDNYFELKLENNKNEEFFRLEKELEKTFLSMLIHDYRYLAFLKFLKEKGFDYKEMKEIPELTDKEYSELEEKLKKYL